MSGKKVYNVFIIEDDKFYRELLTNYFSDKKMFVINCFSSGEDFLSKSTVQPDLIILDYILDREEPNAMDGRDVFKILKQKCPSANIVVLSGQQSTDVVFNLMFEGAKNYITKDKQTFTELDRLLHLYA